MAEFPFLYLAQKNEIKITEIILPHLNTHPMLPCIESERNRMEVVQHISLS